MKDSSQRGHKVGGEDGFYWPAAAVMAAYAAYGQQKSATDTAR